MGEEFRIKESGSQNDLKHVAAGFRCGSAVKMGGLEMGHPWVFDGLVDSSITNNPFKLIVSGFRVPGLKVTTDGYGLPYMH